MARKDSTPKQAIGMLREAEGRLSQGEDRQDLSRSWDLGAELLLVAVDRRSTKGATSEGA